MKIRKFFTVLLISSAILSLKVFSQEVESSESAWDTIVNAGKTVWGVVKDKTLEVVDDIGGAVTSLTSKITVGTWEFVNGKYATTLVCEKDGAMSITQTTGSGKIIYSGTYTASANKITFSVIKKEKKILFVTLTDKLEETWEIDYALPFSNQLKITSSKIPDDGNGYKFSNPTVFTAVKSD